MSFEDAVVARLAANTAITDLLETYNGRPCIFSDVAPKDAERPYLVIRIDRLEIDDPAVAMFVVDVDYFEYGTSRKNARACLTQVEYDLDMAELTNDNYEPIRFYTPSGGVIDDPDIQGVHYNLRFDVRAGRKGWMVATR